MLPSAFALPADLLHFKKTRPVPNKSEADWKCDGHRNEDDQGRGGWEKGDEVKGEDYEDEDEVEKEEDDRDVDGEEGGR